VNAPGIGTLRERLEWAQAGARRVAILDLIGAGTPEAARALLDHLPRETDERAALLIIRHLGRIGGREALPALWVLYERRATPVRVAHAAIVEHDRIVGRTG
jgi:hypothetical protein